MEVAPQDFMQCLPVCGQKIEQWLSTKQHKTLALFLACDLILHLKEQSESVWPAFMPAVFQALQDSDPDVRTPAAYAINLASPLAKFDEAAPSAFKLLGQIVGGPAPKKRDDKGKVALDNAVSALMVLAKEKPALCPAEIPAWQLVVSKLPLKEDEEEAKKKFTKWCVICCWQNMLASSVAEPTLVQSSALWLKFTSRKTFANRRQMTRS